MIVFARNSNSNLCFQLETLLGLDFFYRSMAWFSYCINRLSCAWDTIAWLYGWLTSLRDWRLKRYECSQGSARLAVPTSTAPRTNPTVARREVHLMYYAETRRHRCARGGGEVRQAFIGRQRTRVIHIEIMADRCTRLDRR